MTRQQDITEIAIRCQACSEKCDLANAVKSGWRACVHCGTFVCNHCLADLGEGFSCFSAVCIAANRHFEPEPIPVDRILVFARAQQVVQMEDSFLNRLFFEGGHDRDMQPYVLKPVGEAPEAAALDGEQIKTQTETWHGHHLVITRRRRGKFVTWERVY